MILIVEDEVKLAGLLSDYLKQSQFQTHCIHRGDEVIAWLKKNTVDLILLDLMLPGKDGLTLCREIRVDSQVPIIMTTAKVEEIDRLLGLELGADDYICKPYSPREVVSRVKAVLRRCGSFAAESNASGLQLIDEQLSLSVNGRQIEFTSVEYQLLRQLAKNPGRIFSREQLMRGMYADNRIVSDRTVDSHIKKIRKKLGETFEGQEWLQSVYGAGYRFEINLDA